MLFKKLLAAPVYLGVGFAGTIAFAMLLAPLNLPFLLKFDEVLDRIKEIDKLTLGIPKLVYLVGWNGLGHDDKFPSWDIVNQNLCDEGENPVEKLLSADTFQKALKIQDSFFVQQQMNFIDFIYNKEQANALNKIYELLHKNNQKLSIRDTYRQLHIDKASLLQLVEQNPSLRLDDKYICCDNCDSN